MEGGVWYSIEFIDLDVILPIFTSLIDRATWFAQNAPVNDIHSTSSMAVLNSTKPCEDDLSCKKRIKMSGDIITLKYSKPRYKHCCSSNSNLCI